MPPACKGGKVWGRPGVRGPGPGPCPGAGAPGHRLAREVNFGLGPGPGARAQARAYNSPPWQAGGHGARARGQGLKRPGPRALRHHGLIIQGLRPDRHTRGLALCSVVLAPGLFSGVQLVDQVPCVGPVLYLLTSKQMCACDDTNSLRDIKISDKYMETPGCNWYHTDFTPLANGHEYSNNDTCRSRPAPNRVAHACVAA